MAAIAPSKGFGDYVERVRQANPIRDVVAEHTRLEGNRGRCPFHPDHTPSFSVHPGRGTFKCFAASCEVSGDVFAFIRRIERVPFREAVERLARRGHVPAYRFPEADIEPILREQDLIDVTELVARTYHGALTPTLRAYVTESRKLPAEFIEQYTIGWADGMAGVRAVHRKYGDQGLVVMKASGLARQDYQAMPGDLGYYDSFEDRLVVSTTHLGRIVFLSGRATRSGQTPKYYHQPGREAPLFDEDNLDSERALVTEGHFDALALKAWGYSATAFFGGVRVASIAKLRKVRQPYACFDGDAAGRAATMKLAMYIGPRLLAVRLPEPLDPNDFYCERPREEFEHLLQHALDPVEFALAGLDRTWPSPRLVGELGPVLQYLVSLSPAMAESYLEIIRDTLKLSRSIKVRLRDEVEEAREHGRTQCPTCGTAIYGRH